MKSQPGQLTYDYEAYNYYVPAGPCEWCGKPFRAHRLTAHTQKYCCKICRERAGNHRRKLSECGVA